MYGLAACPCMRALPRRCIYDDWRKLIHEHREAQTGPRFADTSERLSAARSQVTTLTAKRDELVLQLKLETRKHGRGTHGCPLPKSDVAGSERLRLRGELSAMVGQLRASLMTLDMMVAQGSADAAKGERSALQNAVEESSRRLRDEALVEEALQELFPELPEVRRSHPWPTLFTVVWLHLARCHQS